MTEHPPIDTLARFARGVLPPRELAAVAIHVARCETCRTAATRPSIHPEAAPTTYGEAIHRVAGWAKTRTARYNRDRRQAPGALDQILALPTEEWNRAIRSSPRYQSYAFAQHALRECKRSWGNDPYRSERLAELTLEIANRLPHTTHGRRNLSDLRSNAWACIANCRRIRSGFRPALDALQAATEHLKSGTGSERDRGEILSFSTSLLVCTGQPDAALELFSEIDQLSTESGIAIFQVKSLLLRARLHSIEQRPDEALAMYQKAGRSLRDVQPKEGSHLSTLQELGLAMTFAEVGKTQTGLSRLLSIEPERLRRLSTVDQLRRVWIGGVIHWKLGNPQKALQLLNECLEGFIQIDAPAEVGLVAMEMAQIFLEMGQECEAIEYSGVAFRAAALLGVERDALKALAIFREAGGLEGSTPAPTPTPPT